MMVAYFFMMNVFERNQDRLHNLILWTTTLFRLPFISALLQRSLFFTWKAPALVIKRLTHQQ